ncbi:Uncharacterized protein YhiN [hydrothermal vent metagenome]|uniref:Uncharacterized protein YhiN n=1 Tax=hydrothermal vent metagenome TaxID=652676 RepID=A0A3B0YY21_9ZZZZ
MQYDVVILGAGAAGLMCAAVAAARGRKVLLLEKANKPGKKILMSGGGRCNFTNKDVSPDNFLSNNPHFCKSALGRYTQHDFLELVNRYEIEWHEKQDGQLFCIDSAKPILNMLLAECDKYGVKVISKCDTESIWFDQEFKIKTGAVSYQARSLVIASGGLSIPTLGGSDFGLRIARQFGMTVIDSSPGLVPLTLSGDLKEMSSALSGVSLTVAASTLNSISKKSVETSFEGQLLFTHRGLSGPVILQLSSYWQTGSEITIDLLPEHDLQQILLNQKKKCDFKIPKHRPGEFKPAPKKLKSVLCELLPATVVKQMEQRWWPEYVNRSMIEWSDKDLIEVAKKIKQWTFKPSGTEGYRTAEVTLGGVDTNGLDSKTMVSKIMPGLYFIGEAVDVTGQLGGYNFQWAWSSAWVAGQYI